MNDLICSIRNRAAKLLPWTVVVVLVVVLVAGGIGCKREAADKRVATLVAAVRESTLQPHLKQLTDLGPRPSNDAEATAAAVEYITSRLISYGFIPEEERFIARSRWAGAAGEPRERSNIIAQLVGSREPGRILEIGAHYDTVPGSPGADDNTSGTAALLEIARVLAARELKRTVRFCFFAMEEDGLVGSRHHVQRIRELGEKVEGIFVLEMIGYRTNEANSQKAPLRIPLLFSPPRRGDFVAVIGNVSSGAMGNWFEDCADRYEPDLSYYSLNRLGGLFKDSSRSDHSPYWQAGYKGIMLTDTANFRNPNYHKPGDTLATLDLEFLARITRVVTATALEWAGVLR